jgi:hypothetical protein
MKQFISEAQRMQKLAGMPVNEMALPEMARTAGTGGAYMITDKGEEILKQAKATGSIPEGIKARQLEILVFLKKAKNDGRRVQKIDYASEKGVPQPAVNPLFNDLEVKELVAREGYTSKQQEPKSSRPRTDVDAVMSQLDDLDIEESKKTLSENDEEEDDDWDVNQDWNKIKLLGTKKDHQGTWVVFLDPEDPYAEEEGYSFAIEKRQIEQVKNGEKNGVEDGSSISHYMSKQDAKNILSKI